MKNSVEKVVRVEGQETEEFKQWCEKRLMSRVKPFEYLHKQVSEVWQELCMEDTVYVYTILDKLADLMDESSEDINLSIVKWFISDITEQISYVRKDITEVATLKEPIELLLKRTEEIIEQEREIIEQERRIAEETPKEERRKKEAALRLKAWLLELAEHSDEIAQVIDVNKIFG